MKPQFQLFWKANTPLTAAGIGLLAVFIPTFAGVFLDPRIITNMPAWIKPAKFALSTGIYSLTLAWMFRYLPNWPRLRGITGWLTAAVMVLEEGIICLQAARGTTSHFNVSTPLDTTLFMTMGSAILLAWLASVAVMIALFRQSFTNPVLGWALRLGMLITVLGAATGGLMTKPSPSQMTQAQVTHRMPISGAHTVGAPDGGPGLPGLGWSTGHGDLRVAHFIGLHAMQFMPLVALLWKPKRSAAIFAVAGVYVSVFALMLTQALAGQPFLKGLQ